MEITRRFTVDIELDEDGIYIATVPALPGIVEQGDTEEEVLERLKVALDFTVTAMLENGEDVPPSDGGRRVVREVDLVI